jgi:hypothetical protein
MSNALDEAQPCPHCQALEARIAELERRLEANSAPGEGAAAPAGMPKFPFSLTALRTVKQGWGEGWALRPSPARRNWMDQSGLAYQCLPMVVANQWGWQLLCPTDVRATWDGSPDRFGVWVEVDTTYSKAIMTRFGHGIVTFSPPWLFRSAPGWDLYAKGPSNRWKTNCVPLEGVIETWWLPYTFTFNWKIVEPGTVTFARGESLGQLVPVPHGTFKGSKAVEAPIGTEPETMAELLRWRAERRKIENAQVRQHHFYRKAEAIPDHLVRIPVPQVIPTWETADDDKPPTPSPESGG